MRKGPNGLNQIGVNIYGERDMNLYDSPTHRDYLRTIATIARLPHGNIQLSVRDHEKEKKNAK